ncbi:hypothetical protein CAC42_653 [Sphaceloma murrayae]|uniref:Uncharacterized protein n=1 Tax=Sphaceloma murrayae TaxID=2082308 RepID=A0A2K1QJP1_9PEZI|nr:hypothetical protein CAC42_653 [Sphaceloma murrayae]
MTVISKRDRKPRIKRHRACASEFDYNGWKDYGQWRRQVSGISESESDKGGESIDGKKDCWNKCDFPSQCRWGGKSNLLTSEIEVVPPMTQDGTGASGKGADDRPVGVLLKTSSEHIRGSEQKGHESKFREEMDEAEEMGHCKRDDGIAPLMPTVSDSKTLDDIELEIRKSLQRVSDMASEMMVQICCPILNTESKKVRTSNNWKRARPRSGEVTAY